MILLRPVGTEADPRSDDLGRLLVVADGVTVGMVTWNVVHHGRPPDSKGFNLGIELAPEHRGRGYGTAAQRALADYLFERSAVNRVEASTDVTNVAEQRALERAGFTREGVLRGAQNRDGTWHDLVMFSRLRRD